MPELARRLSPRHIADLRESGLSDGVILANGFYTEADSVKIAAMLAWDRPAKSLGACLVIPYLDAAGNPLPALDKATGEPILDGSGKPVPYVRVKPDCPRKDRKTGKAFKYEARRGARNRLYVPAGTWAKLADPSIPVLFAEGEKKACRADQDGYACVGLSGAENWSQPRPTDSHGKKVGGRKLLTDFATIPFSGREAFVCFDSDALHKPAVRRAETAFAKALAAFGATIRVVRLPDLHSGAKYGLDDYLKASGKEALDALFACARNLSLEWEGGPEKASEAGGVPSCSPPSTLNLSSSRRCDRCPPLEFLGARDWNKAGRFGPPCKKLSACAPCLAMFKQDCQWLVDLVAKTDRTVSVTRIPIDHWKALSDHLDRLKCKGRPRSYIIVRQTPESEAFVVFLGAPESPRLTPKSPKAAAAELRAAIDGIKLCAMPEGKRWRPVCTSEDLKRPPAENQGNWQKMPSLPVTDAALLAIYRRHSAVEADTLPAQWRILVNGPRPQLLKAMDEARYGHLAVRYIPRDPGFAGMNEEWDHMLTGEVPDGLPPLSEMPDDPGVICEQLEALLPGLGEKAGVLKDEEDIREILRGAIRWARTHPRPSRPMPPAESLPLAEGELPTMIEGVAAAVLALDSSRADLVERVRASGDLDAAYDLLLLFQAEREGKLEPAPAPPEEPGVPPLPAEPEPPAGPAPPESSEPLWSGTAPGDADPDNPAALLAKLLVMLPGLPRHWQSYVRTRAEAGPDDPENLKRAIWRVENRPRLGGGEREAGDA